MGFGTLGLQSLVTGSPPWALAADVGIDIDFINDRGFVQAGTVASSTSFLTVTRASPPLGWSDDSIGTWFSFGANVARRTNKGLRIETTKTNVVLWNRDLTNVAWTAVNVTVAKDQTGIDGTATSASSLLATAGNGTVLQAITLGSSARWQSCFVKRITGTGTINMTMDNGSTWTAITVTAGWTRVEIPTQTLANPTVGFQIVTNADKIAVDFVQNENSGVFASSPILTTTASQTRATDIVILTTPPTFGAASTLYAQGNTFAAAAAGVFQVMLAADDGTVANRIQLYRANASDIPSCLTTIATVSSIALPTGHLTSNVSHKMIFAVASADQTASFDGGAVSQATGAWPPSAALTKVEIGNTASATLWDGYIERIAIWPTSRITNARLISIST